MPNNGTKMAQNNVKRRTFCLYEVQEIIVKRAEEENGYKL